MDDNDLIKLCKNGEKYAFQELINKYHPFVYKYLLRTSGNEHDAEDLTQEVFVKLIRNIDKYNLYGKASFPTYLITIARNCYIDYYRKFKNMRNVIPIEEAFDICQAGKNIEDRIIEKIENKNILERMGELPDEQQLVIKLKYIEDLTLKEIGEILNIETKTVKSRIHNGIVKLRKMLRGED